MTFKTPGLSVLDLCCGRGGDMVKWKKANVSHYVGLDFSDSSITEAQTRYLSLVIDQAHNPRDRFPAIFIVADAGDQQNLLTDIF